MAKSGTDSTKDSNCPELCFVCNRDVQGKGAVLSMVNTIHSNTPFPTKLMELLGDAFMVVILETDKVCLRCVNLMNQSDKLEQDLKKTQNIIKKLLDEKYNLNEDDERSNSQGLLGTENESSEEITDMFFKESLWLSSDFGATHSSHSVKKPSLTLGGIGEQIENNGICENTSNVIIKSELTLNADEMLNGEDSLVLSDNRATISETILVEDNISLKEKHSGCNVENQMVQEFEELEFFKPKEEKQADNKENYISASLSHTSNNPSSKNETASILPGEQPQHENHDDIKSSNDLSKTMKDVKDILTPSYNHESSKSNTDKVPKLESLNSAPVKRPSGESNKPALITSTIQNHRKRKRKEKPKEVIKKMRPILPKVSTTNKIMPSLSTLDHSSIPNIIPKEESKFNQSIKYEVTDLIRSKERKPSRVKIAKKSKSLVTLSEDLSNTSIKTVNAPEPTQQKYQCSFCPRSFKKRASVRYHEIGHTGDYTHYCEFCGNGFATKYQLEYHRRIHTKEERFVCHICGKKFSSPGTYWIHKKWHENPYPYKCEDCGKPFKHSSPLAIHRRKHRGERPFECSVCHLTFDVKTTLTRHMFLHTKQFPFNCADCSKGFTTRSKYIDHMARKHSVFVKKPVKDPKNFKMAVVNSANEKKSTDSGSDDVIEKSENCQEQNGFEESSFQSEADNCHIEIILPPSSEISENTFSDISWLT